jgi:hypothetical protein
MIEVSQPRGYGKASGAIYAVYLPDFTCSGHPIALFAQRQILNAGQATCRVPRQVLDGRSLVLSDMIVDKIDPILREVDSKGNYKLEHEYVDQDGHFISRINRIASVPKDWMHLYFSEELLESNGSYITGETCLQAFWRTFVVDCTCHPIKRLSSNEITTWGQSFDAHLGGGEETDFQKCKDAMEILRRMLVNWTFTDTLKGFYAMVMYNAKEGDVIAVLDGGKVPVVLREVTLTNSDAEQKRYVLVGTLYLHGFMDGEAYQWTTDRRLQTEQIVLV